MPNMPYNTRRKSLSLPSLGIQLPTGSRAHRSNSKSSPPSNEAASVPPAKRMKRSHDAPLSPSTSPTPESRRAAAQTPPPSPGHAVPRKVDTEGINDDVVISVIEQLERTGNRPHLIKELATILGTCNKSIAHSANPAALMSSRLTTYLKREWTPLSPCPIAKELIPVHPRKVFFFLTTQPRRPVPENSDDVITPDIKRLTPSISDPSVEEDPDQDDRGRMSPSPEVELYSPELENGSPAPLTPGESFSPRNSVNPQGIQETRSHHRHHQSHHRVPSPPLEADERGFTETATAVRARGMSLREPTVVVQSVEEDKREEMSPEMRQRKDQEELFGNTHFSAAHSLQAERKSGPLGGSSPLIGATTNSTWNSRALQLTTLQTDLDQVEIGVASWSLLSPESIEIDELDGMFSGY